MEEHLKYTFFIKCSLGVEIIFFPCTENPQMHKIKYGTPFGKKLDMNGKPWILEIQFVRGCFKEKQEYIILDV